MAYVATSWWASLRSLASRSRMTVSMGSNWIRSPYCIMSALSCLLYLPPIRSQLPGTQSQGLRVHTADILDDQALHTSGGQRLPLHSRQQQPFDPVPHLADSRADRASA